MCARGVRVVLSTSVFTHADCWDSENWNHASLDFRCEEKMCAGMLDPEGDPVAAQQMSPSNFLALSKV